MVSEDSYPKQVTVYPASGRSCPVLTHPSPLHSRQEVLESFPPQIRPAESWEWSLLKSGKLFKVQGIPSAAGKYSQIMRN